MMYQSKFVVAVKSNGKVLREFGDKVYVPFGAEYSIFLKNQNSVKAEVKVSIDGQDVLNGSSLIINANGSLDLERFLKDQDKGNKFKFIERTKAVEDGPRGIGTDDGLVRIEWQFEKRMPKFEKTTVHHHTDHVYHDHYYRDPWGQHSPWYGALYNSTVSASGASGSSLNQTIGTASAGSPMRGMAQSSFVNQVGITAPGSISNQTFTTVAGLNLETEVFSMVLQLCGETEENVQVVEAVTVKRKPTCVICGKVNKATNKCCSECGTSLNIV